MENKSMKKFYVPKSVYDEAFDEIDKLNRRSKKESITRRCHQTEYNRFNTKEPAICIANFLEAARQAWENRNLRLLYEIIYEAFSLKNNYLADQMFEYLYHAIEIDPNIKNRDEVLFNAVKGFYPRADDKEAKRYIKKAHLLVKSDSNLSDSE